MGRNAGGSAKIAALYEEVDLIHHANMLFWERKGARTREASVDYYRRQERLEEIRREFVAVTGAKETE
jgi:hypothetical protein